MHGYKPPAVGHLKRRQRLSQKPNRNGNVNTKTDQLDLIIIGLGPVGALAANLAGRLGLRTVALDAQLDVHALPRAITFDADAMRIFQGAGVVDDVLAITRTASGSVHLGADGQPIRDFRVSTQIGDLGWMPHYMFYQPELDGLLRRRAAELGCVDVRLGWRCDGIVNRSDGVEVTVRSNDGTTQVLDSCFALACDGASSQTREQLGIKLFDYGFEEPWIVIDMLVPSENLGPDHMTMFCDPRRPGTYVPGPGRHRRWEFMVLPNERGEELRDAEAIRAMVGPVAPWLDLAQADLVRSAVYTFHGLVAAQWSQGRVFLAGDAVHQTPPFYGQGMCHGMRDVRNLLWKLQCVISGGADYRLLDTYQAEREPHVRAIVEAAIAAGRYICTLDPQLAARRDEEYRRQLRAGEDVGSFRNVIPGLTAGLLCPEADADSPVGKLFPQPWLEMGGREAIPLDELLGPGFAAVTTEHVSLRDTWFTRALGGRIVSAPAVLRPWFEQHRCAWALVRPDKYVFGVAADAEGFETITEHLREMMFEPAMR